jgi:hypothetical protein
MRLIVARNLRYAVEEKSAPVETTCAEAGKMLTQA